MMGAKIENSRIILTGGASGLGNKYAHHLLLKGAKTVAILDVDVATGTEAIKTLNVLFGKDRAVFFPTDVSKPDQFEASFKKAVKHLGGLDIMINNAGFLDESRWSLMIDLNVKGLIQGTLMAIDVMAKNKGGKGGTVINIGSTASFLNCQYVPIYAATKRAVVGFSQSIALNYERTGVSIKTMCPGPADTPLMTSKAHRFLDLFDQEEGVQFMQSWTLQKPEVLANEVMRMIEEAPNGAVWVNILESPTVSLDIPQYTEWATPV